MIFKKVTLNLLLFVCSLILCFVIGEILIRVFALQNLVLVDNKIWRPDSTFGWRHLENTSTTVNTGANKVHFKTDENGFRINNEKFSLDYKPEHTILMIGDSFLEALQVENRYAFPELIRQNLTTVYNKKVKIVNSSVGGWGPSHYLLEAKNLLEKNNYYIGIIFLYVANDIEKSITHSFKAREVFQPHSFGFPKSLSFQDIKMNLLYPINDFWETKSHLFVFLKNRFQIPLSKAGLTAYYFPDVFSLSSSESTRWDTTTSICKLIADEFEKYKTQCFFVLLPAPYQVHAEIFYNYIRGFGIKRNLVDLEQPNKILKEKFGLNGLELLDPLIFMREKAYEGLRMYGKIDNHFNITGHEVMANYLTPIIASILEESH